jgi:hypothetical protein
MSSGRSIKIALFSGTAFVVLMAALPSADAGARFGGGSGAGMGGGAPFLSCRGGSGFRRSIDAGSAGAVAGDIAGQPLLGSMPSGGYYPQPIQRRCQICTDELQQERGAYSYRIGQRRACY